MKNFFLAIMMFTALSTVNASENQETWTCSSSDKKIKVVATVSDKGAVSNYNGVELKASVNDIFWNFTTLIGMAGDRDTFYYELKLIRDGRTKEGTGKAVLFIDETIDCLGTYTDYEALTCIVK